MRQELVGEFQNYRIHSQKLANTLKLGAFILKVLMMSKIFHSTHKVFIIQSIKMVLLGEVKKEEQAFHNDPANNFVFQVGV